MSMYNGLLLFDFAEDDIGNWQENLGGRGYYEKWENKSDPNLYLIFQIDEDNLDEDIESYEVTIQNDDSGDMDLLFMGDYDTCKINLTKFMQENPIYFN